MKWRALVVLWMALCWAGLVHGGPGLELNEDLSAREQHRRLGLILLIAEGAGPQLVNRLQAQVGGAAAARPVDPEEFKTPLFRIVDQQSMLAGTAYLFRLALEHGAEIAHRRQELETQDPALAGMEELDAVREDAVLVRNAIADSMEYAGLGGDEEVAGWIRAYRDRTLQLRNLMEYQSFSRELDRITEEAIASVGGKLDAYQRMFADETVDDAFDRQIRAAEYRYRGPAAFDEDAGKLAEEIIDGVVLSESKPDPKP